MNENNPYASPEAEVSYAPEQSEDVLASRWARLGGAFIDGLVLVPIILVLMFALGIFDDAVNQREPDLGLQLLASFISLIVFIVINFHFWNTNGQSIGKIVCKTKIVNLDGSPTGVWRIIGMRVLLMQVISSIPLIGSVIGLVNVLAIFGNEKRCLHDHIAGTKVIQA